VILYMYYGDRGSKEHAHHIPPLSHQRGGVADV
jgi:hypothetical protein